MIVFPTMKPLKPMTLAALALGAVLTGGCGEAKPSPGTPTSADGPVSSVQVVTQGGVRLEVTMSPAPPKVPATGAGIAATPGQVLHYTLTNTGTKPVLAYDVVPAELGSAVLPNDVDPKHAWVYEQSGVLRVSKQGFAPAPNVRFAAAPAMGGHVIAAGASISGSAYAAWPLTLDVPGDSFTAPRAAIDRGVKRWQFCVQVDDRGAAQARPAAVGGGVVQAPSTAPEGDALICTRPATIPVT